MSELYGFKKNLEKVQVRSKSESVGKSHIVPTLIYGTPIPAEAPQDAYASQIIPELANWNVVVLQCRCINTQQNIIFFRGDNRVNYLVDALSDTKTRGFFYVDWANNRVRLGWTHGIEAIAIRSVQIMAVYGLVQNVDVVDTDTEDEPSGDEGEDIDITGLTEEVQGIRIGADGTIYETAGEAVRQQYEALAERLDAISFDDVMQQINDAIAAIPTEVDEWLDAHPEATTTVQDGAITSAKLADGAVTAVKVQDGAITEAKINSSFLQEVKNNYVTPQMYGAVGDGLADDTTAMQSAINSDKPLLIPKGTYVITSGLTINRQKVIIGEDQYTSRLLFVGATETAITLSGDFIHFENFSIHSDSFDYSVKGTTNAYTCISATDVHYSTFNNLRVVGFNEGMRFVRSWSNSFTNLIVLCCNTGFYGADEFNQALFSHCCLNWCLNAVWIQGGRTIVFDCCDIERNNLGAKIRNISDVKFIGCYFELNTNGSINVDWANKPVPICIISDCSFFENADCTGVVFYHMAESGKLIIEKCYFSSNDLGTAIIPILTPINGASTKTVPILIENVIGNNYSAGTKNFVDYNYMPVAISSSDFITLNADYSLADFAVYKEGRHIYGTFTVVKSSAFVSGDNNVGVISSKYLPLQNINTYGALTANRWQQSTNNLCYVFLSPTALAIKNGDGTSTIAKVIVNYAAKES